MTSLTRHSYGAEYLPSTVEARQRVVDDWKELAASPAKNQFLFGGVLAAECEAAAVAIGTHLAAAGLAGFQGGTAGFDGNSARHDPSTPVEIIFEARNFETWRAEMTSYPYTYRATMILFRPGIPRLRSRAAPNLSKAPPTYLEVFPALDLEFRFDMILGTEFQRRAAIVALKKALERLREMNAHNAI